MYYLQVTDAVESHGISAQEKASAARVGDCKAPNDMKRGTPVIELGGDAAPMAGRRNGLEVTKKRQQKKV